jgi:hypothetical protein
MDTDVDMDNDTDKDMETTWTLIHTKYMGHWALTWTPCMHMNVNTEHGSACVCVHA